MRTDDCRRVAERLTPWVDDLLAAAERYAVDDHLDACLACRQAAALERRARLLLQVHAERLRAVEVPRSLLRECEALLREDAERPGWPPVRVLVGSGMALLGAAVGLAMATGRSSRLLAAQLAADHLKCFHVFGDPAGSPDDAVGVEAFVREWYGWAGGVPPSSDEGAVRLLGVRRCLYARGVMPHVMYRAGGQDVSLYMLHGMTRTPAEVVTLGCRARLWPSPAGMYALVSRDGAALPAAAVAHVMRHAR